MTRSTVLRAQAGYYVATGVLPFFSRHTFERVTGPKLEVSVPRTVRAPVSNPRSRLEQGGEPGERLAPAELVVGRRDARRQAVVDGDELRPAVRVGEADRDQHLAPERR